MCQRENQLTRGKLIHTTGIGNHSVDIRTKSMEDVLDNNDISLIVRGQRDTRSVDRTTSLRATTTLPRNLFRSTAGSIDATPSQPSSSHSYDCLSEEGAGHQNSSMANSKSVQNLCRKASNLFNANKIYPPKSDPNIAEDRDFVTRL